MSVPLDTGPIQLSRKLEPLRKADKTNPFDVRGIKKLAPVFETALTLFASPNVSFGPVYQTKHNWTTTLRIPPIEKPLNSFVNNKRKRKRSEVDGDDELNASFPVHVGADGETMISISSAVTLDPDFTFLSDHEEREAAFARLSTLVSKVIGSFHVLLFSECMSHVLNCHMRSCSRF